VALAPPVLVLDFFFSPVNYFEHVHGARTWFEDPRCLRAWQWAGGSGAGSVGSDSPGVNALDLLADHPERGVEEGASESIARSRWCVLRLGRCTQWCFCWSLTACSGSDGAPGGASAGARLPSFVGVTPSWDGTVEDVLHVLDG